METTQQMIQASAWYLGQRLEMRNFQNERILARHPLVIGFGQSGHIVIYRYGVMVTFGLSEAEEATMLETCAQAVMTPYLPPLVERIEIQSGNTSPGIENAVILVDELSTVIIQVIADILAKNVILEFYEQAIAAGFDQIEPLAQHMHEKGRALAKDKVLLSRVGDIISVQSKMVGRVEVSEKPDTLWEYPEFEKFYQVLSEEFEIRERHLALERKLSLINETTRTLIDLLQHKRSLRVEWYIVILIMVDIVISLVSKAA